ncbi:gamma-aminobutyric acid receptor subunit theta [Canis lupus baileyi]|uniref:Gamma-aminobutyric acid receptor subunit theta n=1 Tax=Canis lupus familiaris TaxID=9615 RepID=A0A8C0SPU1_CANLF|nr:gamma-aminobutyric acid receptor subunit theta [Canis lupus familiaris]XP_025316468.1 gamma-aminobutyric acid receptor subunit theta [Canis lupus dingo]XP_038444543.1 gamma-aminobutyric acid receptor subunit theta [Canis lupus familiaris]|eukprot:XP_013967471.1 gamma-aminobutyric acid receptor subunit theta [Canis lupus familiaris]
MGIRGILRAAVLLLLIRTWLAEGNEPSPTPKFHFELSPTVPEVILNLFNCKKCANEGVVHKILDRVLSNYDVRLRPNFGGAPVPVGVSMYVSSIEQISEMTMDYTITMFFHQTWKDPRLAYHETDLNLTLDYRMLEKLWVPDCYFLNSKDAFVHDVTVENRVFQLHPDGTVRYGMRLTTTAACSLDLQKFPLDKQTCKLEVESYGYTVEDIVLYWEGNGNAIQGTEKLHIPQFSFLGKTMSSKEVFFYTGSYVRLILRFLVQREVTSYLVQIYWPTVLTTVVSWISFWMNYESSAARVTVGLTSMLILNAINSHLRDKLPQVACIKAIDIYMVVCFLFVFLSLLEYVYINYLYYSRGGSRRNQRRRRRARRVMARYRYREVMLQPFANRRSQEEMILSVEEIDTHIATVDEESPLSPLPSPPPVLIHVGLANPDAINVSTISLREDQISIEDESGSLSSRPARACLASLESLSSLTSIPGQAPLATAESLSSLSSLSELASLASRESLSDLPSTPEQAPHRYGIHVNGFENDDSVTPTEMRNLAEAHDHAEISDPEDPEENFSLDESPVHIPSGRPLLLYGHRHVREASCSLDEIRSNLNEIRSNLDEIRSLPDDIRVESGYLDLEKQLRYDLYNWRPNAKKFMRLNRRKDSNSESDDSCPPSPGCSFTEGFSSKLFDPDYVPKVDKWSRILFPLAFVVFNIVYWAYHLN